MQQRRSLGRDAGGLDSPWKLATQPNSRLAIFRTPATFRILMQQSLMKQLVAQLADCILHEMLSLPGPQLCWLRGRSSTLSLANEVILIHAVSGTGCGLQRHSSTLQPIHPWAAANAPATILSNQRVYRVLYPRVNCSFCSHIDHSQSSRGDCGQVNDSLHSCRNLCGRSSGLAVRNRPKSQSGPHAISHNSDVR